MALSGSRARRTTRSEERSSRNAINAENSSSSAEDVRRNRPNVRRYVRTTTEKRDWTVGDIHQRFERAVDKLGGQDSATPKKILQLMEYRPEGLTLGQVKSHLQMYRKPVKESSGANEKAMPRFDQRQAHATSLGPTQPRSGSKEMAEVPAIEALMLLRGENLRRRSEAALLRDASNDPAFQQTEDMESMDMENIGSTLTIVPVVELNDNYRRNPSVNIQEHELLQQDPGQSSTYQPDPRSQSFGTFLGGTSTNNPADETNSLSGSKRKGLESIGLELTMATRSHGPNFQFSSPSTQEEAELNLALS